MDHCVAADTVGLHMFYSPYE